MLYVYEDKMTISDLEISLQGQFKIIFEGLRPK